MNKQPEMHSLFFVFRGAFNPIIFSPVWFASEKLIRNEEAEKAETQIVHPDVVSFNLDWLRLQVTRDMFFVETTTEPYEEVLRDLVFGVFKLLRHTPLKIMGINRAEHFRIDTIERWHKIGHILAPKSVWNDLLENSRPEQYLNYRGDQEGWIEGPYHSTGRAFKKSSSGNIYPG